MSKTNDRTFIDRMTRRLSGRIQLTKLGVDLVGAKLRLGFEDEDAATELSELERVRDELEAALIAQEEQFWETASPARRYHEVALVCDELRIDRWQWARRARQAARDQAAMYEQEMARARTLGNRDHATRAAQLKARFEHIASTEERTLAELGAR